MDRVVIAHTPLGSALLFKKLTGVEQLSDCYKFDVEMLSTDNSIDLQSLLGEQITMELRPNPTTQRFLSGIITRMEFIGHEKHLEAYFVYRATVRPHLWNLTQTYGFRIWQQKTARAILTEVFQEYDIVIDDQLEGDFRNWDYCVQYQESLYDFVKRIMEHEGIYFYFRHEMGKETLVLCNSSTPHKPFGDYATIEYHQAGAGGYVNQECIDTWHTAATVSASLHSHDDYNYEQSNADLSATSQISQAKTPGNISRVEWPGRYPIQGDGTHYAQIRQQEQVARQLQTEGAGDAFGLAPGYTFALCLSPRAEDEGKPFLITQVAYHLEENSYTSNDEDVTKHRFCFSVVPASITWRPARSTAWPRTTGPQTAVVIKASDASKGDGEHVSTDQLGRVRVKFHWFKADDETKLYSCWMRVSSGWAGNQYGAYQIPRVGEEVVVDFINGDPHTPVVVGRVYNDLQPLPVSESGITEASESEISDGDNIVAESAAEWNYAKSGIWSRTLGSQDPNDGNFLSFDDTEGEQSLDLHGAKQINISAKEAIKIFSEKEGEDSIKMWSPGKIYIQSEDTLSTSAPTQRHSIRGSYYTVSGANFTTNGIGLTINGVNGTINLVSNFQYTTSEFSAKGIVFEYGQIKYTRNHAEFKKTTHEVKDLSTQIIRSSLVSFLNGGGGGYVGSDTEQQSVRNTLDRIRAKKQERRNARNNPNRQEEQGQELQEREPEPAPRQSQEQAREPTPRQSQEQQREPTPRQSEEQRRNSNDSNSSNDSADDEFFDAESGPA